jgi:hypothetical protein
MPRGISCSSSLTNTSWNARLRLTVPRMPSGFQSPLMAKPSLVAGTARYSVSRASGCWSPLSSVHSTP